MSPPTLILNKRTILKKKIKRKTQTEVNYHLAKWTLVQKKWILVNHNRLKKIVNTQLTFKVKKSLWFKNKSELCNYG